MSDQANMEENRDTNAGDELQQTTMEDESDFVMLNDILPVDVSGTVDIVPNYPECIEEPSTSEVTSTYVETTTTLETVKNDLNHVLPSSSIQEHVNQPSETIEELPTDEGTPVITEEQTITAKRKYTRRSTVKSLPLEVLQQDSSFVEETPKKRRGRKPKRFLEVEMPQDSLPEISKNKKENLPVRSKRGRKDQSPEKSSTSLDLPTDTSLEERPKKKRGRKKKVQPESETLVTQNTDPTFEQEVPALHMTKENSDDDDDDGDIALSQLKKNIHIDDKENGCNEISSTGIYQSDGLESDYMHREVAPILSDFEYNANKVISVNENVVVESMTEKPLQLIPVPEIESNINNVEQIIIEDVTHVKDEINNDLLDEVDNSLLIEDSSRRPKRRTIKRNVQYDSESDDPFANMEESDDASDRGKKRKKGKKYYSDDEYVPGMKKKSSESSEESILDGEENTSKRKRKVFRKKSDSSSQMKSPRKRGRPKQIKETTETTDDNVDDDNVEYVEVPSQNDSKPNGAKSFYSNEFENFLARRMKSKDLQIKKLSASKSENVVAPLEIPVIDQNIVKKYTDTTSQTESVSTTSSYSQTTEPYSVKVVKNLAFDDQQSVKACKFLGDILKTTSELGSLLTDKSQEFIQKKINTTYVVDTVKMDYCMKKAFLLFKLAKDNLTTMEENLQKQYEEFMNENNLSSCIETDKKVTPKNVEKVDNGSDSDCEIVETTQIVKPKKSSSMSSIKKTVFLNKELSIKIAKNSSPSNSTAKPGINKNEISIKGSRTVWLNNSILVKKVNTNQSFLAQDGRNKKPPDYITEEMVKKFFLDYEKKKRVDICRSLILPHWTNFGTKVDIECYYFMKGNSSQVNESLVDNELYMDTTRNNTLLKPSDNAGASLQNPKALTTLCTDFLKNMNSKIKGKINGYKIYKVDSLSVLALNKIILQNDEKPITTLATSSDIKSQEVDSLLSTALTAVLSAMKENISNNFNEPNLNMQVVLSLKSLARLKVSELFQFNTSSSVSSVVCDFESDESILDLTDIKVITNVYPETLKQIAFECVRSLIFGNDISDKTEIELLDTNNYYSLSFNGYDLKSGKQPIPEPDVKNLKQIAFECVRNLMLRNCTETEGAYVIPQIFEIFSTAEVKSLKQITYECVAKYFSTEIEQSLTLQNQNVVLSEVFNNYSDEDDFDNDNTFDGDYFREETTVNDSNEVSNNWLSQVQLEVTSCNVENNQPKEIHSAAQSNIIPMVQIKQEICEAIDFNLTRVKDEPEDILIPTETLMPEIDSVVSKRELLDENGIYMTENIFTQNPLRIKRQFEPDSDNENENDMDLLVPHASEVLVEAAKEVLMESSSDTENREVRKRGRPRKKKTVNSKPNKEKEKPSSNKQLPVAVNKELANITRRMKEKIFNTENQSNSSDEDIPLLKKKSESKAKSKETAIKAAVHNEIQCNDVDSTEQIIENTETTSQASMDLEEQFMGFNPHEQNIISTYQKYVDAIHQKAIAETQNRSLSPVLMDDELAEMLECAPTISDFGIAEPNVKQKTTKETKKVKAGTDDSTITSEKDKGDATKKDFTDRNGWHCYQINSGDSKLHQSCHIPLHKLPEVFIEMYYKYLDVTSHTEDDAEVDRLSNLQTLHRNVVSRDNRPRPKCKKAKPDSDSAGAVNTNADDESNVNVSYENELEPSDDEALSDRDESPAALPLQSTENHLAKSSLMDDNEDDESKTAIKTEKTEEGEAENGERKSKTSKKDKKLVLSTLPEQLVLTADKMMKKELDLLHAPVKLGETYDVKPASKSQMKLRDKTPSKAAPKESKSGDDSSSEEEKQWVTTKEKLLKRMKRGQDSASMDDAKRAKMVSEFIVKRNDESLPVKRKVSGRHGRGRRANMKYWERQKQLNVLKKEFYGESAHGPAHTSFQAYAKGRRNIRKVIDKKSLARSTVLANMEEFERKKRLIQRQNRLREVLGCEEGVNLVVINDQVCLEYDFDNLQPVVSVHPFFTKVMKAHQYEGVKFMWDACFESLQTLESGSPGGGCILAHCMGLGKTLQVLALLHTVLTHPRANMKRVLVCCPLSTVLNWVDEIHQWLGPVTDKIKVFELSKLKKIYERAYQLEDWYNGGGIFIIGYELFRSLSTLDPEFDNIRPTIVNKIRTALLNPGPDIIVCDEGHLLKNNSSVLAMAMSRVSTKRRIVLTGTPMQNNLREYFCMVNFIKPNLLGTYSEYSNRFENPIMNGQHRDSVEEDIKLMKARTHILHKVLECCLQRQEASVLYPYLPTKREYTLFIPLTECQADLYSHYLTNYSKHQILKDYNILQKIWSHPLVLQNFYLNSKSENKVIKEETLEDEPSLELAATKEVRPGCDDKWWLKHINEDQLHQLNSSYKFETVFKILNECVAVDDKLLIFSTSLYTMDSLEYFLKKMNQWRLGREYYRLDGSVPAEVRQKWCREFNCEDNHMTKLFLISTRAGCLGLNMTAANRVIILDTSWNPAHDIQSIFRIYRFGQKKDCFIYRLVALGTMEQKIYERSVTKQAVSCRVIDEQQIDRHYNMSDLAELYSFTRSPLPPPLPPPPRLDAVSLAGVARAAAYSEHDSLLRRTEDALPDHERDAAWDQFTREQERKQIQNDLSDKIKKIPRNRHAVPDVIKQEDEATAEPRPKRGRRSLPTEDTPVAKPLTNITTTIQATPDSKYTIKIVPDSSIVSNKTSNIIEKMTEALKRHKFNMNNGSLNPEEVAAVLSNVVSNFRSEPTAGTSQDVTSKAITRSDHEYSKATDPGNFAETVTHKSVGNNLRQYTRRLADLRSKTTKSRDTEPRTRDTRSRRSCETITSDAKSNDGDCIIGSPTKGSHYESILSHVSAGTSADISKPRLILKEKHKKRDLKSKICFENDVDEAVGKTIYETITGDVEASGHETITGDVISRVNYDSITGDVDSSDKRPQRKPWRIVQKQSLDKVQKQSLDKLDLSDPNVYAAKRSAAVAAENTITQLTEDESTSIDLDDDVEYLPPRDVIPGLKPTRGRGRPKKSTKYKKINKVPEPASTAQLDPKAINKVPEPASTAQLDPKANTSIPRRDDSIILSDDDEPLVAKVLDNADRIALPRSLLKNQNFIKIVAHTYLKGNPLLAEDAAVLAAEYSASKALKEIEETGKEMDSGPIYDIAIKVLGRDVIKKMNVTASKEIPIVVKSDTEPTPAPAPHRPGPKSKSQPVPVQIKPGPKSMKILCAPVKQIGPSEPIAKPVLKHYKLVRKKAFLKNNVTDDDIYNIHTDVSLSKAASAPTPCLIQCAPGVVPVSLIQNASHIIGPGMQVDEECILPDDDVCLLSSSPPQHAAPVTPAAPSTPYSSLASPTIISVSSAEPHVLTVSPLVRPPPAAPSPAAAPASKAKPKQFVPPPDNTICLDSDDEDTPQPVTTNKPKPPEKAKEKPPEQTKVAPAKPQITVVSGSAKSISIQTKKVVKDTPMPASKKPSIAPREKTIPKTPSAVTKETPVNKVSLFKPNLNVNQAQKQTPLAREDEVQFIIDNVVHIDASNPVAQTDEKATATKVLSDKKSEGKRRSNVSIVQSVDLTEELRASTSGTTPIASKLTKVKSLPPNKVAKPIKALKSLPTSQTTSVDLTDVPEVSIKAVPGSSKKVSKIIKLEVKGKPSFPEILKLVSKVSEGKNITMISSTKRPAAAAAEPKKKKPAPEPKTLEQFSLDDFEDIIELE